MPQHAVATAFAVMLLLAASPMASSQADEGPEIVDPEGDATENNSAMAVNAALQACRAAMPATSFACIEGRKHVQPGRAEPVGGTPAPPALDILSVSFDETPTDLLVRLEVASLDEALTGLVREDPTGEVDTSQLNVWWSYGQPSECWDALALTIDPRSRETLAVLVQAHEDCPADPDDPWLGGCNAWFWCEIRVGHTLEYGSPGAITFEVPRAALLEGEAGATLVEPRAMSLRAHGRDVEPWWQVRLASGEYATGQVATRSGYVVDATDAGREFALTVPRAASEPAPPGQPHAVMPTTPGADPRTDILALDVRETPETITIDLAMADVPAQPEEVWFWLAMDFPSGHVAQFFIQPTPEGERTSAGRISVGENTFLWGSYEVFLPTKLDVQIGTPGTLSITMDRSDLPPILEGQTSTLLVAAAADDAYHIHRHEPVGEAAAVGAGATGTGGTWQGDYTWGTPLYVFEHDTPAGAYEGIRRVHDPPGDVRLAQPSALTTGSTSKLDITFLEVRAVSETMTDFTIGVHDLSRATVPTGYDAMFYAFGVRVGDASTMLGYYKSADDPAGDFLCAPDITVLSETQRDPAEAVWTTITGIITAPQGHDAAAGGGGPGAITTHVPHECFGTTFEVGDAVSFDEVSAGTFLVRNGAAGATPGAVEPADAAQIDGAVSLPVPRPLAPASAWYVAPFGYSAFWDILGLAAAIVVGGTGAALKLHRRKLDKQALADAKAREDRDVYRAALARAVASRADVGDDEVLSALRRRLGISEREHAILELEARAAAGVAITGLAHGARFLGKYRVERQLGEGGFARTFLARDEKLARRVVLKIARWPSPTQTRRALHEARALAQLDHPNIVKIHDVDEVADQVVLVLEHVAGGSLAERPKPAAPAEATALVDGVLAALEAAHARGIVHRDVKPANILLTREGVPKLADFGVARVEALGVTAGASVAGAGAGTLQYMAPEQARGQGADERSDVYAAGAVLYELLAGRPYLDLSGLTDFEARAAIAQDAPALPLAGVDEPLNALLRAALAKDPASRPRSAGEMRRLLALAAPA